MKHSGPVFAGVETRIDLRDERVDPLLIETERLREEDLMISLLPTRIEVRDRESDRKFERKLAKIDGQRRSDLLDPLLDFGMLDVATKAIEQRVDVGVARRHATEARRDLLERHELSVVETTVDSGRQKRELEQH